MLYSELKDYRRIVFFEEAMCCGSISEKLGEMLEVSGFAGDYSRVAINGFVKQASIRDCLDHLGLTAEKMTEYVLQRSIEDGQT